MTWLSCYNTNLWYTAYGGPKRRICNDPRATPGNVDIPKTPTIALSTFGRDSKSLILHKRLTPRNSFRRGQARSQDTSLSEECVIVGKSVDAIIARRSHARVGASDCRRGEKQHLLRSVRDGCGYLFPVCARRSPVNLRSACPLAPSFDLRCNSAAWTSCQDRHRFAT